MDSKVVEKVHAPTGQSDDQHLMKQVDYFAALPVFTEGFDATDHMILIINSCRQVVFANKAFLKMVNITERREIYGKKGGQIIKCIHANEGIDGCGTSDACRYCILGNSILKAIETNEECTGDFSNLNTMSGYEQNSNLSIHIAPLQVQEEIFYVVSFTDNSNFMRKRMLERVFFHDMINTVGALKGIMGLLKEEMPNEVKNEVEFVEETFKNLAEEIQAQRDIMSAESNQLILDVSGKDTGEILKSLMKLYEGHELAIDKTILLDPSYVTKTIYTDHRILRRILGNMIKNALEATDQGGRIILGCDVEDDKEERIKFWVNNEQYMDIEVQSQVFHRLFSTKGNGRGLGTYSVKLLGERYLGGKVNFMTTKERGTYFYITLPLKLIIANEIKS